MPDSAKCRDHLRGEQLQMRLRPPRRQSRRQRPRIVVRDGDVVDEVPNHAYRRLRFNDLEKPALPQLFAIAQIHGKGLKSSRREPGRVMVGLIEYVVGGLGKRLFGIVGDDQTPKAACESTVIYGPVAFLQLGDIAIIHISIRFRHGETNAIADGASQRRLREAAQPDRGMGFLDRFRRDLDVLEVEEFTLQGNTFSSKNATNDLQGFVGARSPLLEGHPETFKLFQLDADSDAEFETAP